VEHRDSTCMFAGPPVFQRPIGSQPTGASRTATEIPCSKVALEKKSPELQRTRHHDEPAFPVATPAQYVLKMQSTRTLSLRLLRRVSPLELPPVFLCPVLQNLRLGLPQPSPMVSRPLRQRRCMQISAVTADGEPVRPSVIGSPPTRTPTKPSTAKELPLQCPGCGAYSQTDDKERPGFYDVARNRTRRYLGTMEQMTPRVRKEDDVVAQALSGLDTASMPGLEGLLPQRTEEAASPERAVSEEQHLCERCHSLVHHHSAAPFYHPNIDAIRETIDESPYKRHHVYHVLDAADFPMSLVPNIHRLLAATLRPKNRRAQSVKWFRNRQIELSFIITRSDLLAPKKEQVDRLMPWIIETLRDALGRVGKEVRLGNVRCVSAKRGWWIKDLKEDLWDRGGVAWMVGKANVGKSYLFHHIFPKGRMTWDKSSIELAAGSPPKNPHLPLVDLQDSVLLPPLPPETEYPPMPLVSPLPGTTAAPIRLSFGDGKGELIDLPGLERSQLADFVAPEHHASLVMKTRVQPEQETLKGSWHSLLLGGLIRITPRSEDLVHLCYNFTPLQEHKTQTTKAEAIIAQTGEVNVPTIGLPETKDTIRHAGSFPLKWDVTRRRTGPITRRDAAHISVDRLPYRVLSTDILIEGVGWVEVTAQVRTKDLFDKPPAAPVEEQIMEIEEPKEERSDGRKRTDVESSWWLGSREPEPQAPKSQKQQDEADSAAKSATSEELNWPVVDVYSPEGRFISARRPLNGWMLCKPRGKIAGRPRPAMKGVKKEIKRGRR
jgi:genetic interactor of prohibitins 3, mitochondrial